jgi:hypothetical protein
MLASTISEKKIHSVPIRDIDDLEKRYAMSFDFDIRPLVLSMKNVGMLNPPTLLKTRQARLIIVIGFRRILAAKALDWDAIPCRIISDADISGLDCLRLSLFANLAVRKFNDIEKGMILRRLSQHIGNDVIRTEYMPLLDLPAHEPTLQLYLRIDRELEDKIKQALVDHQISLNTVKHLLIMDKDARSCVIEFFLKIKFNFNQQRYILEYIYDISNSTKTDIRSVLNEDIFKNICSDKNMNDPQKASSVLRALRVRLFPRLSKAEEVFKKKVSKLKLPENVSINPPLYFESPLYRLEALFKDGEELKNKIMQLNGIKEISDLGDPWEEDSQ